MKKVIASELMLVLLLAGVMTLLLYRRTPREEVSEAEVQEMFESVAEDASVIKAGPLKIRRVFGLNAADYDLAVYYTPAETMDVCEFFLVRAEREKIDEVKHAMENRISSQLSAFEHYGERQTELLRQALLRQFGDYICLIVSEHPDQWLAAVRELLGV